MFEKDTGMRNTTIKTFTQVTLKKEKLTEKDSIHGRMGSITKENGTWGKNMDLGNGKAMEENLTLEIGNLGKLMEKAHTYGKTEMSMKETGWNA